MSKLSLSFTGGRGSTAIATVSGGEYAGKTLYLNDGFKAALPDGGKKPKRELNTSKSKLKLSAREQVEVMKTLQEAHRRGIPAEHLQTNVAGAREEYERMLQADKKETAIQLPPNSQFALMPSADKTKREIWYVAGASGSGKSYIAKGLAEKYHKMYPERSIFLVSKLNEDETLDSIKGSGKPIRLSIAKLVESPMEDKEELRDSLIIFDDYDRLTGKESKAVRQLMDDIATMGRHTTTSMLCLSHYLSNYKATRLLLTEASHFVLYPSSTGSKALGYLLETHLGLDKEQILRVRKCNSRWCCLYKNAGQYCITESEAYLLNQD
jgi:hypothetical protein